MTQPTRNQNAPHEPAAEAAGTETLAAAEAAPKRPRLDPTRYGDWELNGKCVDF
jgi:hypothetical protein